MASEPLPATPLAGSCADVAVVVLNWNGAALLRQFLPAVLAHAAGAAVVVADNASTDDSVALLAREFPAVRVIRHSENLGFCRGYNDALDELRRTAAFRYYVLLNSDVAVTPGWLPPLRQRLEQQPATAAVQPKILDYARPTQFEYAGAGGGYLDRLGYPFCRGRLFDTLEADHGQYDDPRPVAWASGACLLVRAAAWHALGGLAPEFFAHMEEIDFCWRCWNAGYAVWYEGGSTVYHVGGGTLPKSNPRKTYLNFRNGLALVYRNAPAAELRRVLPTRLALDWVAAARLLAQGSWAEARAIGRAHRDFFRQRKRWQQQRRENPPHLHVAERPGVYAGSLVWAYFVRGKRTFGSVEC